MRRGGTWLVVMLVWMSSAGVVHAQQASDESAKIFARVGDDVITVGQYRAYMQDGLRRRFFHGSVPENKRDEARRELTQELVDQLLLYQEAQRQNIAPDKDFVSSGMAHARQKLLQQELPTAQQKSLLASWQQSLEHQSMVMRLQRQVRQVPLPTLAAVQEFYRQNPDKFTTPERLKVSVILLGVEPWAPTSKWQAASDEAVRLLDDIRQGKETFEALARLKSTDQSAANGGDLGYVHRGMLSQEAQQAVDGLQVGELSAPVRVLKGIAVFRLDDRVKPVLNPFSQAEVRAQALLHRQQQEEAWQSLLKKLRADTPVTYVAGTDVSE